MVKTCWIDVETTGLIPTRQDIIQLAGIIEINGVAQEEFEFKCQPYSYDNVEQKALDVHGYSIPEIRMFPEPRGVKKEFEALLGKYVNKFDRQDKFVFAGYNTPFDFGFVSNWFKKAGDTYFGSWFEYKQVDVYPLFYSFAQAMNLTYLPNHKLETAAKHFGIPIQAHDALSDIRATRMVCLQIQRYILAGAEALAKEDAQLENGDATES